MKIYVKQCTLPQSELLRIKNVRLTLVDGRIIYDTLYVFPGESVQEAVERQFPSVTPESW